jgi:hypothetical protein
MLFEFLLVFTASVNLKEDRKIHVVLHSHKLEPGIRNNQDRLCIPAVGDSNIGRGLCQFMTNAGICQRED